MESKSNDGQASEHLDDGGKASIVVEVDDVQAEGIAEHEVFGRSEQIPVETETVTDQMFYFRSLRADDIDQVRELHEEWFPIRYNQAFYDGAAQGRWTETGGPLFTRIAISIPAGSTGVLIPTPSSQFADHAPSSPVKERILGVVTASTLPLSKVDDKDLIADSSLTHTHIMYILTLGSRSAVRRKGIASALVQECISQAQRQPNCGAVYLHVKADNLSALRFYEKNGFRSLRFLPEYYIINGVRHDAYLYIRYVNGASPPYGWFDLFTRPFLALFSFASFGWRKVISGLIADQQMEQHATANTPSTRATSLV